MAKENAGDDHMVRRVLKEDHGSRVVEGTSGNAKWAIEQAIATGYIATEVQVTALKNGTGVKISASDGSKVIVYHSGKVAVGGPIDLQPAAVHRVRTWTSETTLPPNGRKRRRN